MSRQPGFRARFRYWFDNFMSRGGFSIFMALLSLFVATFVLMGAIRLIANNLVPDQNLPDMGQQLWRVFLQISDAGAVAEDGEATIANKVIGIVTIFLGLVLFSSLVAFITSQFEAMLDNMRKGRSRVIEKNHTLILGFNDRSLEIIRELIIANESERRAAVVVLAATEKDQMDDFFRDQIDDAKTTRIVTRQGISSSMRALEKVNVCEAKSIVILNDVGADAAEADKALADARVLKTIMAVVATAGENEHPPIVAELHLESKRELARTISSRVQVIEEHTLLAKLIVQTSRVSGLALVYDELVGFDGCEFYFHSPDGGWGGKTYGQLQFHYAESAVIGLRDAEGNVELNPPASRVILDDEELLLIAEDDSVIRYQREAVPAGTAGFKPGAPQPKNIERQLVVGWSNKTGIIVDEYSQYMVEGSGIDVLVASSNPQIAAEFAAIQAAYPAITMRLIEQNIQDPATIALIQPEQYDNVIILKEDGGDPELRDSETIAILLAFRHYFRRFGAKNLKTQLISEVADSANIEIIQEVGVKDFLISNKFVSKLYAQVAEEPDILKAYCELFKAEGSEIYLKPVGLFLKPEGKALRFADLCAAASRRGESCFGVRIKSQESDASRKYGLYVNPSKDAEFVLGPDDYLMTLAEDES